MRDPAAPVRRPPMAARYGVAVASVAVALATKVLLDTLIPNPSPFLLLSAAVMVGAWFGGLGAGLVATAVGSLGADYFFLAPVGTFTLTGQSALPVALFAAQGVLISLLAQALHSARDRAEASTRRALRDHKENVRLYEELAARERELKRLVTELQDLVGRILSAQEEERRRVAYEVHDSLTQMIVAAQQRLEVFAEDHPPESVEGREELEELIELLSRTVDEARRIIAYLRPTTLDDFGLATALRLQVEELNAEGYEASYEQALDLNRLPLALETSLFRVAQEALTNARKHAETDRLHIALGQVDETIRLEVSDWGRGFDPAAVKDGGGPGERVGLSSIRERVGLLGGAVKIRSAPGEGTSLVAEVPLPEPSEDSHGG